MSNVGGISEGGDPVSGWEIAALLMGALLVILFLLRVGLLQYIMN